MISGPLRSSGRGAGSGGGLLWAWAKVGACPKPDELAHSARTEAIEVAASVARHAFTQPERLITPPNVGFATQAYDRVTAN
jgi:hypothetical protein